MGGARLKVFRVKAYRGPEKGVQGAKPPGRWRIFEKINENFKENFKKYLVLLWKISIV